MMLLALVVLITLALVPRAYDQTSYFSQEVVALKHHRFVLIHQHAIFRVQAHGLGQYPPFHIATLTDQVIERIAVVAMNDILPINFFYREFV